MKDLSRYMMQPLGMCPGCGRPIGSALDFETDKVAVFHRAPPCKDFEERDPLAFVIWVRESRGLPPAPEDAEN